MSKKGFQKYKKGQISIEIQSLIPEKFLNLLWKNNISIKNVKKKSITCLILDIELKDYGIIEEIAKKTNTKIKIIGRKGLSFLLIRLKRRIALAGGFFLFLAMLYFLSTFIWSIDIETEKNVSPYEVRQKLNVLGVKPGVNKRNINVYDLEEKLIKGNDDLMWVRARIEGATLKIKVAERQPAPNVILDTDPCDLLCKRDGQIVRIYTTAGTAMVKVGDIVKNGQLLVKGEQGKEGSTYPVHAKGNVIAKTFYEEIKEVPLVSKTIEKTGKLIDNYYIEWKGKKFYLKKNLNKFQNYDTIIDTTLFIKKETIVETREKETKLQPEVVKDETVKELYNKITLNLNQSVKIVDKIIEAQPIEGNKLRVRLVVIAEENIAYPKKISE